MGYFISDRSLYRPFRSAEVTASNEDVSLVELLEFGTPSEQRHALRLLVAQRAEAALVRCLASEDAVTGRLAMEGLWECWLEEKGADARAEMEQGIAAMNEGNFLGAAEMFRSLISAYPDWAEPVNKFATLLYLQGSPDQSIDYCRRAVKLKPDHFGAWNGLALCAIQVENWTLAHEAVLESLRLQPRSIYNEQLLALVESRLPPT